MVETNIAVAFAQIEDKTPLSRLEKKQKSRQLAEVLLRQLFELYGENPNLLTQIERTDSGRPFIPNSHIDFNISHSGNYVAVIAAFHSPKKAVGIDVEHPQKTRRFLELLEHYAPIEDQKALLNPQHLLELARLEQRFYLDWCLREAVLKSQGAGIVKLAEVRHCADSRTIKSTHCPSGKLYFYHQLPFFLAYFVEAEDAPQLYQWQHKRLEILENLQPIIYEVN